MLAHRIEATIAHDRTLTLENLPFYAGEPVEIIILSRPSLPSQQPQHSLRGTVTQYSEPFEPIAQDDWELT